MPVSPMPPFDDSFNGNFVKKNIGDIELTDHEVTQVHHTKISDCIILINALEAQVLSLTARVVALENKP